MTTKWLAPGLVVAIAVLGCSLTRRTAGACLADNECRQGERCSMETNRCVPRNDGGSDAADASPDGDGGGPECTGNAQCMGAKTVCDVDAGGVCVGCLGNGDCGGTTPICETQEKLCRGCRADAECAGEPGVCMEDGRCAGAGEVVYVEASAGCPDATRDGTLGKPFCTPTEAVAVLMSPRTTMIVRGAVGPLALGSGLSNPVLIIGRQTATDPAQIDPGTGAGIAITGGEVTIRDLSVVSGGSSNSKGITIAGASTKVRLRNVKIALGTGLGIEANSEAQLEMDRCVVEGNSLGGILINSAGFEITNTIIADNGPGFVGPAPWGGIYVGLVPAGRTTKFLNNTVVLNDPIGTSCLATIDVTGSIVFGNTSADNAGCTIISCCTGSPNLTISHRLMTGSPCIDQLEPARSTSHDIDGQPRPQGARSDCGADEFIP